MKKKTLFVVFFVSVGVVYINQRPKKDSQTTPEGFYDDALQRKFRSDFLAKKARKIWAEARHCVPGL